MTDPTPADAGHTHADPLCTLLAAADSITYQLWAYSQDRQLPHEIQTHTHAAADHTGRAIREAERAGLVLVEREPDKTIRSIKPATGARP